MFCTNCGKELISDDKYCPVCGMPVSSQPSDHPAPPPEEPDTAVQSPTPPLTAVTPTEGKPPRQWNKALLFVPAVVIAAAALVAINFTAIAARVAPTYALSRGVSQLSLALEQQAGTGPASVLPSLGKYLAKGTTDFSLTMKSPEYDDEVSIAGRLISCVEDQEFLLEDLTVTVPYEETAVLSAYLSGEAFAVRDAATFGDDDWYGIHLELPLEQQNRDHPYLGPEETLYFQNTIDTVCQLLDSSADGVALAIAEDLKEVFEDFLSGRKPSVSSHTVPMGASGAKATVLTYRFDAGDLAVLVKDLFDVLLKEEYAQAWAAAYFTLEEYAHYSDDDLESLISELERARDEMISALRKDDAKAALSFALSSDGTLIQAAWHIELGNAGYDEPAAFSGSLSFGGEPAKSGTILLECAYEDGYGNIQKTTVSSKFSGSNHTMVFSFADSSGSYMDEENSVTVSTDWNPHSKKLSTSFTVVEEGKPIVEIEADGLLTITDNTFALELDEFSLFDYNYWEERLDEFARVTLSLNAKPDAFPREPNFKNLFEHEQCRNFFYTFIY